MTDGSIKASPSKRPLTRTELAERELDQRFKREVRNLYLPPPEFLLDDSLIDRGHSWL
jgi:hypothetical protein